MSTITIPIPEDLSEAELVQFFASAVSIELEREGDLLPALDLDLEGDREQLDDVTVAHVEVDEGGVHVTYVVHYSAYLGCRDANYADTDHRTVYGIRSGDCWEFDLYVSPPKRYPNEEL